MLILCSIVYMVNNVTVVDLIDRLTYFLVYKVCNCVIGKRCVEAVCDSIIDCVLFGDFQLQHVAL